MAVSSVHFPVGKNIERSTKTELTTSIAEDEQRDIFEIKIISLFQTKARLPELKFKISENLKLLR